MENIHTYIHPWLKNDKKTNIEDVFHEESFFTNENNQDLEIYLDYFKNVECCISFSEHDLVMNKDMNKHFYETIKSKEK